MAKSKESFNKKEKQKLKQKKRKEKAEKKEERKSTSTKKSFDDMIAYVDENGRISSTPPDLTNKKKIKSEDIQISTPKQEKMEPDDGDRKGTVTFFNDSKGYGFIKDHVTQESIFVHLSGLIDDIRENDVVSFKVEKGPKGLAATEVKK